MTRDVILTVGLLLTAGLAARVLADLLRLPEMIVLLAVGALLGPSVLGVVDVPFDALGAQLLFTFGVSAILFHGGLHLSVRVLREVAVSLGLLAVPGMLVTAVVAGGVASLAFGLPFTEGLLIGAVLSPTDPAILIPLFIRSRLRPKVAQAVVAESALNDPTGAVLALALTAVLLGDDEGLGGAAADFVGELALSSVAGAVAGVLLALLISSGRVGFLRDSAPLATLGVVAVSYVSLDYAGGSGYLGAFIAGLIVGNMDQLGIAMHEHHEEELAATASSISDVVIIFVFLVVGASLPFDTLAEEWVGALVVVTALLLVARPLTVLLCTLPDRRARWTRHEIAFLCWTRETGVVPAALVGVLAALGAPNAELMAAVVAVAIVATLALQAAPAPWLARRLGLLEPATEPRG